MWVKLGVGEVVRERSYIYNTNNTSNNKNIDIDLTPVAAGVPPQPPPPPTLHPWLLECPHEPCLHLSHLSPSVFKGHRHLPELGSQE